MSSIQATEPTSLTFKERCERLIVEQSWFGDFPLQRPDVDIPQRMEWIPNKPEKLKSCTDLNVAFMGQFIPGTDPNKDGENWNMCDYTFREMLYELVEMGGERGYLTHNYCRLVFWFSEIDDPSTESNGWTIEMENVRFPTGASRAEYTVWNGDHTVVNGH